MVEQRIYTPMPAELLPTIIVPVWNGEAISSNCLYQDAHIPEFGLIIPPLNRTIVPEPTKLSLVEISEIHGRSYELVSAEMPPFTFEDEFGNLYSSRYITKGNNFEDPRVRVVTRYPLDIDVAGLLDTDTLDRSIRASKVLRQHFVDTELTTRILIPQVFPVGETMLDLSAFREYLRARAKTDAQVANLAKGYPKVYEQVDAYIDTAEFAIVIRSMQSPERLDDLVYRSKDEFEEMMERTFTFVNFRERIEAENRVEPDFFDIDNPHDLPRYFTTYLPKRVGRNIRIMHNLGLVHANLHEGNIATSGSIYDLDTIRGVILGLGDAPITDDDIFHDLQYFFGSIKTVIDHLVENDMFTHDYPTHEEARVQIQQAFLKNFYEEYFKK